MSSHFIITRVSSPDFESLKRDTGHAIFPESRRLLGDQSDFGRALPSAYRALANPLNPVALPRKADTSKDWAGATAYWHCLQHLVA